MLIVGIEPRIMMALQEHLGVVVLFPALPIAYIGVNFAAPDTGMWLEAKIFPAPVVEMGMADASDISHRGVFQVGVIDGAGKGAIEASEVAATIIKHFKKGTELSVLDTKLRITNRPSISGPIQYEHKLIVPIEIRYQCFE